MAPESLDARQSYERSQVFMSKSLTSCSGWVQRCRVGRARGRTEHTSARLLGMVARARRVSLVARLAESSVPLIPI